MWIPTDLAAAAAEGETRTVPGLLAGMALALGVRISYVKIISVSKGLDEIPWL